MTSPDACPLTPTTLREHRAEAADRHRYPKRQLRNRILTILGRGPVLSILTLLTIVGLLSVLSYGDCQPLRLTERLRDGWTLLSVNCVLLFQPHWSTGIQQHPGETVQHPLDPRSERPTHEVPTATKGEEEVHYGLLLLPFQDRHPVQLWPIWTSGTGPHPLVLLGPSEGHCGTVHDLAPHPKLPACRPLHPDARSGLRTADLPGRAHLRHIYGPRPHIHQRAQSSHHPSLGNCMPGRMGRVWGGSSPEPHGRPLRRGISVNGGYGGGERGDHWQGTPVVPAMPVGSRTVPCSNRH